MKRQLIVEMKPLVKEATRLERGENERRSACELHIALVEELPISIYVVQDGKIQFVNAQFLKYTGFDRKELLGTHPLTLVYPDDRERVREDAIKVLKGQRSFAYEFYIDITEYKEKEEKVKESEERYHLLFESFPDCIAHIDKEGRFLTVNPCDGTEFRRSCGRTGRWGTFCVSF